MTFLLKMTVKYCQEPQEGGKKPAYIYEPGTAEDTADDEFDYYPLLVAFSLIGAATGAYFVSKHLKSSPRK